MEIETQEPEVEPSEQKSSLYRVTPLSKYLAMALFVLMPFIGGWVGYNYAPEKVVIVEKVIDNTNKNTITETQFNMSELPVTPEFSGAVFEKVENYPTVAFFDNGFESVELSGFYISSTTILNPPQKDHDYMDLYRVHEFYINNLKHLGFEAVGTFEKFTKITTVFQRLTNDGVQHLVLTTETRFSEDCPEDIKKNNIFGICPETTEELYSLFVSDVMPNKDFDVTEVHKKQVLGCFVDSDCVLVQPDCEDCHFAAIGQSELDIFRNEKKNRCDLSPTEAQCDSVFSGDVQCIDNTCQLVE